MQYVIVGTGGIGGCVGSFLAQAGKEVIFLARNEQLIALRENGLFIDSAVNGSFHLPKVNAVSEDEITESPDVVIVSVKGYSLSSILPLLNRICTAKTVIIPLLNVFGTGDFLREQIPQAVVCGGCIYMSCFVTRPGHIQQVGQRHEIIFGALDEKGEKAPLLQIAADLKDAGMDAWVSQHINADSFIKCAMISAFSALSARYGITAGELRETETYRREFFALLSEAQKIADAKGFVYERPLVDIHTQSLARFDAGTTPSLLKDLKAGKPSEMDGQIFQMVRLAHSLGVDVPVYERFAQDFGYTDSH